MQFKGATQMLRHCFGPLVWLFSPLSVLISTLSAAAEPAQVRIATFSILAADPEAGLLGAAVASFYPAVGRVVPEVRAGVGAFCTQHYHVPEWRLRAIELLVAGRSPAAVLAELLAGDDRPGERQLALVDQAGNVAVHHPNTAGRDSDYWGGVQGRHFACQGNTLAGREVLVAMAAAYEAREELSFADRLVAALVAGDRAGGDHRGRLAAGLRVARRGTPSHWLELDIDRSASAVEELAERYLETPHPARGPLTAVTLNRLAQPKPRNENAAP